MGGRGSNLSSLLPSEENMPTADITPGSRGLLIECILIGTGTDVAGISETNQDAKPPPPISKLSQNNLEAERKREGLI